MLVPADRPVEDAGLVAAKYLNMAAGADSLAVEAGCNLAAEGYSVSSSCGLLSRRLVRNLPRDDHSSR